MGRVIYTCPFVPREWIAAHGLDPVRIMPGTRHVCHETEGACPFMSAFISSAVCARDAVCIVMTTVCDQMRRGYDLLKHAAETPVFLMNVPTTWQTSQAQALYVSELHRLGSFLQACGGSSPSPGVLAEIMRDSDDKRCALRNARDTVPGRTFSEAIAEFNSTGSSAVLQEDQPAAKPLRLALLGGPLLREQLAVFDVVAASGGKIVLDGSETGERTLPRPFDRSRLSVDPLFELADAYFGSIPDVSRRPNTGLYDWLRHEVAERQVQGVILVRQTWCDLWHAEAARLKAFLDAPLLDLDLDAFGIEPRAVTRMEAFMEMLAC